jgi:hypothetical protein
VGARRSGVRSMVLPSSDGQLCSLAYASAAERSAPAQGGRPPSSWRSISGEDDRRLGST